MLIVDWSTKSYFRNIFHSLVLSTQCRNNWRHLIVLLPWEEQQNERRIKTKNPAEDEKKIGKYSPSLLFYLGLPEGKGILNI